MKIFYVVLGVTVSWLQQITLLASTGVQGMAMRLWVFCCASEHAHVQASLDLESGRVEDIASS